MAEKKTETEKKPRNLLRDMPKSRILKHGRWYVAKEQDSFCIRRELRYYTEENDLEKKSSERHPKKKYKKLLDKYSEDKVLLRQELEKYCNKLNYKEFGRGYEEAEALKKINANNPWITPQIRTAFHKYLSQTIPNKKDANYKFNLCERKFLKFFLDLEKIPDPDKWKTKEHLWGLAILNKIDSVRLRIWPDQKFRPSIKTIKSIIQTANQFIKFLSKTYPDEFSHLQPLYPLSRAQMRDYEGDLDFFNLGIDKGKYMPREDFDKVIELLQDGDFIKNYLKGYDISPFVSLAYKFGLRRSESLGLTPKDVRRAYLSVERQLKGINSFGQPHMTKTKGKFKRKTPFWFSSPEEAHSLISKIGGNQCKLLHPDTLGQKFKIAVNFLIKNGSIEKRYIIKDCRSTFITEALRAYSPVDVQLASGHKDLRTTMGYQQDDRNLDDEIFSPTDGKVLPFDKKKSGS